MDDPQPLVARPAVARDGLHPPFRWGANAAGDTVWFSPEWGTLTGQSPAQSAGIGWMDCVHPEDRGRILEGMHQARGRGIFSADLRILAQHSGGYSRFRVQALPTGHNRAGAKRGRARRRLTWAALMKRVFGTDVLKCDECPGRMRVIANIEEPAVIVRILRHLGLRASPPVVYPARAPPAQLDWVA